MDLLAVQGTLKSLLQHHSSKASLLQCSAFFMIQLSHPFIIEKPVLIRQSFVVKVMSLFFNMLSRLVIALLPMSKCIFVSWVQILEPKKIKSVIVSIVSPSSTHEVKALYATILFFFNVFAFYVVVV